MRPTSIGAGLWEKPIVTADVRTDPEDTFNELRLPVWIIPDQLYQGDPVFFTLASFSSILALTIFLTSDEGSGFFAEKWMVVPEVSQGSSSLLYLSTMGLLTAKKLQWFLNAAKWTRGP